MDYYNKHYIRVDEDGNITHGFSDAFEKSQDGDILINAQGGRQFELLGKVNPQLQDLQGNFLYKWDGKEAVKA